MKCNWYILTLNFELEFFFLKFNFSPTQLSFPELIRMWIARDVLSIEFIWIQRIAQIDDLRHCLFEKIMVNLLLEWNPNDQEISFALSIETIKIMWKLLICILSKI